MVVLVLLNDGCNGKEFSCYRGKNSGTDDSYMSVAMACLNMALEAKDLGIDSCILTPTEDAVRKMLKVKKSDAVPLMIGLGFQNKKAFQKKRERLELQKIMSFERFGEKK